jgi:tight adherence protein B
MDGLLLPILIAGAVGLLGWTAFTVISKLTDGQKRKLNQRLSTGEPGKKAANASTLSIVLPEEAANVPEFLARKRSIQTLRRKLAQTFPDVSPQKFLTFAVVLGAVFGGIAYLVSGKPIAGVVAGVVFGYLPIFFVGAKYNRRHQTITLQLPEALDFLSRIMRAGHSLSTGLQMMSEELPAPLSAEFRKAYDQHSLGQPLEDALRDMAGRVESTDFAFFVTAVLIQKQTGGDLSEVLTNISKLIRQRMRLSQQVKAKTAEGRFTGYIMVAFPAVMFTLCFYLNPDLYGGFAKERTGMMLLGFAAGLVILGLFAIKKITTVRV